MELGKKKKKSKSVYVKVEKDRVIRKVDNLKEAEVVMLAAKQKNMLGKSIIDTRVLSEDENLLEHRKIKHILHSGEYTVSMAYDVTKLALDMALEFIKSGIYSYDLLPYNFTFENGNWVLYDFGALKITPDQIKTQIRSIFKISFSAFELTKVIDRASLKHYYLNRIKLYDLIRMIPPKNWIRFTETLRSAQVMCTLGLYERAYTVLRNYYNHYEQEFVPEVYEYKPEKGEKENFDIITNTLKDKGLKDIFCVGESAGKWAIKSDKALSKFVYLDDYDLCDKYYNYLKEKKAKNISTGVLYPLMEDDNIPENLRYRALYDYFAKERFLSEGVVADLDEFMSDESDVNNFCRNISDFAEKIIILKTVNVQKAQKISDMLKGYFSDTEVTEAGGYSIISAYNKISAEVIQKENKRPYKNCNRMKFANSHTFKTMQILKVNKQVYRIKISPIEFLKKYSKKISIISAINLLGRQKK